MFFRYGYIDLRVLFQRAKLKNFKFSLDKSEVGVSHLTYLGHIIGGGKIKSSKQTINKIENVNKLGKIDGTDKHWMKVFGFYNFSSRYIKHFAKQRRTIEIMRDQYKQLKIDMSIRDKKLFSREQLRKFANDFDNSKTILQNEINRILSTWSQEIKTRILTVPDKNEELLLVTDASDVATGYALYTKDKRIVQLGGKTFTVTQSNYTMKDKELLGIVKACEQLRLYIARAPKVTILCDNKGALANIKNSEKTSDRSILLAEKLQQYPNLKFEYINTKKNVLADLFSRHPELHVSNDWGEVMSVKLENDFDNRYLMYREAHHHWGHPGRDRFVSLLKLLGCKRVCRKTIKKVLENCPTCVHRKAISAQNAVGKLRLARRPCDIVSIDHYQAFSHADRFGFKYVLSLRDTFSKLAVLFPCKTKDMTEVKNHIRTYIQINGRVNEVRMDNYFRNEQMTRLGEELDFKTIFTPIYRPQANAVERLHRDLRILLPDLKEKYKDSIDSLGWSKLLPIAANIINTVPHSITGHPPYLVHKGYLSQDVFEERSVPGLKTLWTEVGKRLAKQQKGILKTSKGPFSNKTFEEGDAVYAHLPNQPKVPCVVLKDYGDSCLVDKGPHEPERFRIPVVHKSRLTRRIDGKKLSDISDQFDPLYENDSTP